MNRLLVAMVTGLVCATAGAGVLDDDRQQHEWNFTVYLDDAEIGYHNFQLVEEDGVQRLTTVADFEVKFLFFTAFSYEHVNEETWNGECLASIESRTVTNGKTFAVSGHLDEDGFEVEAASGPNEVSGCVKTFAYWNPGILDETVLMNSQTGELLPVTVSPVATETLLIRGKETTAKRYRLEAKNMQLDVWYSQNQEWLALESTVKGGRKLRYELT
jgi:hypothetical protein